MHKLIGFFRKPLYRNGTDSISRRGLLVILLTLVLLIGIVEIVLNGDRTDRLILISFSTVTAISLFFALRNNLLPGRVLVPMAGFVSITLFVFWNGIHDEAVGGYYLMLVFSGLLLGDRGLLFSGAMNALAILSIGSAEHNGWIVTPLGPMTELSTIFTATLFMLCTTLALHYMVLLLNLEARHTHENALAELAANEQLRNLQVELESRVTDRTAELQAANEKMMGQIEQINALQARLREEAVRDPLTGLFNRRYLEETLVRELGRAHREEYDISFLLFDIDRFKKLNDTCGHDAGDQVLKVLSNSLVSRTRTMDIPCRIGGEEFLLVLPGVLDEVARLRAEYLRDQIQATTITHGVHAMNITVSIGISSYPKNGQTWEDLYHAADQAMYRAKQKGRNRVECA